MRCPHHNLRADFEYCNSEALCTHSIISVKFWDYKGDTLGRGDAPAAAEKEAPPPERDDRRNRRLPPKPGAAPRAGARRRPDGEPEAKSAPEAGAADAPKTAVKRVRKAPGAPADAKTGE